MKDKIARKLGVRTYRRDPSRKAQQKANRELQGARRDRAARALVEPSVAAATCEELIAAGWSAVERHHIPADWRTRRPGELGKTGPKPAQDPATGRFRPRTTTPGAENAST